MDTMDIDVLNEARLRANYCARQSILLALDPSTYTANEHT